MGFLLQYRAFAFHCSTLCIGVRFSCVYSSGLTLWNGNTIQTAEEVWANIELDLFIMLRQTHLPCALKENLLWGHRHMATTLNKSCSETKNTGHCGCYMVCYWKWQMVFHVCLTSSAVSSHLLLDLSGASPFHYRAFFWGWEGADGQEKAL